MIMEREREYQRQWSLRNKEKVHQYQERWNHTPKGKYSRLKRQAKKRGIPFDLDKEEFLTWFAQQDFRCIYCGIKVARGNTRKPKWTLLTIDRKDNKIGYNISNIVIACRRCNAFKGYDISYSTMSKVGILIKKERMDYVSERDN